MKGEGTVPWRRDTTCIYDCRDGPLEKGGKCSLGCDNGMCAMQPSMS